VISCPPISTEIEVGPATAMLIVPPLGVESGGLGEGRSGCDPHPNFHSPASL
jgi:hypothetical protein